MYFTQFLPNYSFETIFIYLYLNCLILFVILYICYMQHSKELIKEKQQELENIRIKNKKLTDEFYGLLKGSYTLSGW